MQTNIQTSQTVEIVTKKEVSMRRLLNIIGMFIFSGLALSNVTNPLPTNEYTKQFLLFIGGSASIYFCLVSFYFIGGVWRKVFYTILMILCGFSLFMVFYLVTNSVPY